MRVPIGELPEGYDAYFFPGQCAAPDIAVMREATRLLYAMLKRGNVYASELDAANAIAETGVCSKDHALITLCVLIDAGVLEITPEGLARVPGVNKIDPENSRAYRRIRNISERRHSV